MEKIFLTVFALILFCSVIFPAQAGAECATIYAPVCGVDGNTYGNECEAGVAGVEIAYEGECDQCPGYPKLLPGICGCAVSDTDTDGDSLADCIDNCPSTSNPNQADYDNDGTGDACDLCAADPDKTAPGICGCGIADTDSDNDGTLNCNDSDDDNDGILDPSDNCSTIYNPGQIDRDNDGVGDFCDDEILVNTYTTSNQENPSVAMDASANYVITWQSDGQDGNSAGIFAQMYDSSGSPVGSEFQVNTYTTDSQALPSIAMDAIGNYVITWQSDGQDGDSAGIFAQMYDSSGIVVGSEFQVNTQTAGNQENPSVAMNASGNFVITWLGTDGVSAQMYDNSGNPVGSELHVNAASSDKPSVAIDSTGNFVITWLGGRGIKAQRYDSYGNPVGSEFSVYVPATNRNSAKHPSVAMDANGNFVITWLQIYQSAGTYLAGFKAQMYDSSGNPVGSAFWVGGGNIAMNAGGNFVITYRIYRNSSLNLYAQMYDSSGNPVGSEFQVNTYTIGSDNHLMFAATMDATGNFVIAWSSDGDGDGHGVFMKAYAVDPDRDRDGIPNGIDNCQDVFNDDQSNYDGDALGDACDPDDDNDGMPDVFEVAHGFNSSDANDANDDADYDGLTNLAEYYAGTDPQNADTDGDGVTDGFDGYPLDDQRDMCIDLMRNDNIISGVYSSVYDAINDPEAADYDTIQITAASIDEDILFDRNIILTLSGGYYCNFSDHPTVSSINSLIITNGKVKIDNISIAPICGPNHIENCTSDSECTFAGGFWWSDNTCLGVPESETVVSAGGRIWMDRNLGASRVAISPTDSLAYGDLYQWGRGADGHQFRTSATTSTLSSSDTPGHGNFILGGVSYPHDWRSPQNANLWQGENGINNPCPRGFRLPTRTELSTEVASWSSYGAAGAFASPLKLVPAGLRHAYGGTLNSVGSGGSYWSSSVSGSGVGADVLVFGSSAGGSVDVFGRAYGFSVRCIKD